MLARPGSNFQNAALLIEFQQFGHSRYDKWLRDRLIKIDRQGVIAIGAATQGFGNKKMARHIPDRFQSFQIANAVMLAQAFNHALAGDAVLSQERVDE